jgi:5-formyltetrahydrofolate cyclo-ligase
MADTSNAEFNNPDSPSAAELRKLKRNQRRALPESIQKRHSQALCENITRHAMYKNCTRLACYIANDGEIDPYLIIEHASFAGKKVYLPVLSPLRNSLYFAPYTAGDKLNLNRFSIPEPTCHPTQWIKARQLDLLLMPLVAFDVMGSRLGMGGGFYDRTLAYLRCRRHWKKPTLAGLAHEIQKTEQLSRQNWDIPLDYIVTEQQIYTT